MRGACLITFGGSRGQYASQVLTASGFTVHRVHPIFASPTEQIRNSSRPAFSNMITQHHIWDHPCSQGTYTYVFEDDIEFPIVESRPLHLQLDYVESLHPAIVYLGTCAEHWSGISVAKNWTRCAPLCAHAYAVRNTAQDNATILRKTMRKSTKQQSSSFYRTNWDVIMRGYYIHTQPKKNWPICSRPNIFYQNRTRFSSTISS